MKAILAVRVPLVRIVYSSCISTDACVQHRCRETADKLTPEERDEGWQRIYTYREWLLSHVFKVGTIVVLPVDEGKPNYRDALPP